MSIREKIAERLFGTVIEKKVQERMQAAVLGTEEPGFRKLTGSPTRALPSVTQERMIEISYWLWKTNPLGNWLIEIVKDFVLAEGITYDAENEKVKEILDQFWLDPVNRMDLYLENYVRELGIYGEQIWPAYVSEQTGRVRLGYIDPASVKEVVTDPENVKVVIGVILKAKAGATEGKKYRVILDGAFLSKSAKSMREKYRDGEVFFFRVNNVTNAPRGTSDLFVVADWLDGYEQFLFDYADKWPMLNAFVWDVLLEGMDEAQIEEWLKKNGAPPKPGSVRAHNEKVKWTAVTPELKAVDADKGARLLRNHILGARGLPEHWYGGGGDVNRATAAEMGLPTMKMLSARQQKVKHMIESLFTFVIRKALDARYLQVPEDEAFAFSISIPEIEQMDIAKYSTALQQLTASLVSAKTMGWIDDETAQKAYAFGLAFLGFEYDPEAVREKLKEEKTYEDYQDYQ
ncbi:MAG: hypothetical protein GXP63_06340 [DPANN group archaeon]|nr:hypothetical protein [DPANN group archaeon]